MERSKRVANTAWVALLAGVAIFDAMAEETMSSRFDDWLEHPIKKICAVGSVALMSAHLLNVHDRLGTPDPIQGIGGLYGRISRRTNP